jgi:hypothetical protein
MAGKTYSYKKKFKGTKKRGGTGPWLYRSGSDYAGRLQDLKKKGLAIGMTIDSLDQMNDQQKKEYLTNEESKTSVFGSINRGFKKIASTKQSGWFGSRGRGPQNEGGLTSFFRGSRRLASDLMGNRNAKTRKSSWTNISKINPNTVASISAKVDAIMVYLGVPYLFTDKTYATNYIISKFNPGSQSNDGRGFLRLTESQTREIYDYIDKKYGGTNQTNLQIYDNPFNPDQLKTDMANYRRELDQVKQQIDGIAGLSSGISSLFGSQGQQPQSPLPPNIANSDVEALVKYMVLSTVISFMVDKLEKETKTGTFEIDPDELSSIIETQISIALPGTQPLPPTQADVQAAQTDQASTNKAIADAASGAPIVSPGSQPPQIYTVMGQQQY